MIVLDDRLDPSSPVPLYHQLFLRLADRIRGGALRAGDYLPSERDLAAQYGVGRITAVRALNELALAELVAREQGRGTRVNFFAPAAVRRGPLAAAGTGDGVGHYDPLLLSCAMMTPPSDIAEALALTRGDTAQQSVRVLRFGGRPYAHITAWVPGTIARYWSPDALATLPLGALLAAAGVTPGRSAERVTARLADADLARLLDVTDHAPLLEVTRTTVDTAEAIVEHALCRYVPERYRYVVDTQPS